MFHTVLKMSGIHSVMLMISQYSGLKVLVYSFSAMLNGVHFYGVSSFDVWVGVNVFTK